MAGPRVDQGAATVSGAERAGWIALALSVVAVAASVAALVLLF